MPDVGASIYLKQLERRTMLVLRDSTCKGRYWHCVSSVVHMLLQYANEQVQGCKGHLNGHMGGQSL